MSAEVLAGVLDPHPSA